MIIPGIYFDFGQIEETSEKWSNWDIQDPELSVNGLLKMIVAL